MSFKKFRSDVATAAEKVAHGAVAGVLSVANGDSDGEVVIKYRHESLPSPVTMQALAQDVAAYPDENTFMLWTNDDQDPPAPVVAVVECAHDFLFGMSVYEMVIELASRLDAQIACGVHDRDGAPSKAADDADADEDKDDSDITYDSDCLSDGELFGLSSLNAPPDRQGTEPSERQQPLLRRIRQDLRRVREAGYKVGFLDSFGRTNTSGLVSISIRVDKLGLSDELTEAWDVQPGQYIVLLLRFERPYKPLERVLKETTAQTDIKFCIRKCSKYKPSAAQAADAFQPESKRPLLDPDRGAGSGSDVVEKLFISNSLDGFLNEDFVSLLRLREARGLSWDEANKLHLAKLGTHSEGQPNVDLSEGTSNPADPGHASERDQMLSPDHLLEVGPSEARSFPLIAMQFTMRYLVKCTEFCLRCHRRLEKGFEALRPYVCSDPLCLFQYIAMGLGPSIEHEILTQPYVVDLLVSMCYAATQPYEKPHVGTFFGRSPQGKSTTATKLPIRTLPVGLRIQVPNLSSQSVTPLQARLTGNGTCLLLGDDYVKYIDLRWIAFRKRWQTPTYHARILAVRLATKSAEIEVVGESGTCWDTGYLPSTALAPDAAGSKPQEPQEPSELCDVFPYNNDFDGLEDIDKAIAMRHVLDTLPSILDIEEWLNNHPHCSFRSMDRISPAAATLLQWIVSSNRSCISQVDPLPRRSPEDADKQKLVLRPAGRGRNREHERILGMGDEWVQFRFVHGSPDKELRFNRALKEVAQKKPAGWAIPTIFAWHGSKMANWHSIVRTGLDYETQLNGRAFGHGVYFSSSFDVSATYLQAGLSWPNSDLKISACLSLNEIINAPERFVSRSPHYVVSQLDWHQCRYLFVKKNETGKTSGASGGRWSKQPTNQTKEPTSQAALNLTQKFHPQEPGLEVRGPQGRPLQIPLSAIPLRSIGSEEGARETASGKRTILQLEDSDDDGEDTSILFSDDESDVSRSPPPVKRSASHASSVDAGAAGETYWNPRGPSNTAEANTSSHTSAARPPTSASVGQVLTDFEPGTLDLSALPRLEPPSFATETASRALARELQKLQAIQAKTALHELGWYMDFDQVTNLFQWIVELHSFDRELPLARDMRQAGVRSVVLEVRFPRAFPFDPPFVRVVRPRFLPFAHGGGGHVTAGGALCMELLTGSGWSPANSMESVLLQVRMALCSLEPRPARLDAAVRGRGAAQHDYGVAEAVEAFTRAATVHGWAVPENLRQTARGY